MEVAVHALTIAHENDATAPSTTKAIHPTHDNRDYSLGLGMIRRVCERWGWALDEAASDGGGRAFVLRFV